MMMKTSKNQSKKITFKPADLVPLTAHVLAMLELHYLCFSVKLLVHYVYPDLKGMIETDCLDEESVELLNASDEDFSDVVGETSRALGGAVQAIACIYRLDLDATLDDKRLITMYQYFYSQLIIDDFPRDNNPGRPGNLDVYYVCMINAVACLCYHFCGGKVSNGLLFGTTHDDYQKYIEGDYSSKEHAVLISILQDLVKLLESYLEEFCILIGKIERKGMPPRQL